MDDAVAVATEIVAGRARWLGPPPPAAQRRIGRIGSALPERLDHHVSLPRPPMDPGQLTPAFGALNYRGGHLAIVERPRMASKDNDGRDNGFGTGRAAHRRNPQG